MIIFKQNDFLVMTENIKTLQSQTEDQMYHSKILATAMSDDWEFMQMPQGNGVVEQLQEFSNRLKVQGDRLQELYQALCKISEEFEQTEEEIKGRIQKL